MSLVVALFNTCSKPYCVLGPEKVSLHSAVDVFVGFGESTDWVGLVKQPSRGRNLNCEHAHCLFSVE